MGWELVENKSTYLEYKDPERVFRIIVSTKLSIGLKEHIGYDYIKSLIQVHSSKVYIVDSATEAHKMEGDGLITKERGLFIGVKVADCYPVFLLDYSQPALAVLHVGWRGAKEGIIAQGVNKLVRELRSDPDSIHAVIGPGICVNHYEVGEEFREYMKFQPFLKEIKGKLHLDLHEYIKSELKDNDIYNIVDSPFCTYEREDLFWSKRRDGKILGEMWAFGKIIEFNTNIPVLGSLIPL